MADTSNAIDVIDLEEKEQPANAWEYFKQIGKDCARCLLCGKKLTTKNRSITGSKNKKKHLFSIHKLSNFCEQSKKKQGRQVDTVFMERTTVEPKLPQIEIDKLDRAAVVAIIIDGRSFSDFVKDGMGTFLAVARPGYKGLSRKKLAILFTKRHRKTITKRLENVESISLTTDFWSSKNRMSLLVFVGHFIEKRVLRSITLSFF